MPRSSPLSLIFPQRRATVHPGGSAGAAPRRRAGRTGNHPHGGLLTQGETILRVGPTRSLEREALRLRAEAIDCRGRVVMPGFVDSHTHLIFAGSRVNDYELRLRGRLTRKSRRPEAEFSPPRRGFRKASCNLWRNRRGSFSTSSPHTARPRWK